MEPCVASARLALLLLAATACGPAADRADAPRAAVAATTPDSMAAGHAERSAAAGRDGEALLPIMKRLGSEMTALTSALMTDDHEAVTRSAAAIAAHAPISARELERIHHALGPDMPAFEAVDESVHVASVRLRDAARARRPGLVVERLGEVQRGCVSCHARFRQRLRTSRGAP